VISRFVRFLGLAGLAVFVAPRTVAAQARVHPRWEIPGFDISKNNIWRIRAQRVRAIRAAMLSAGQFDAMNTPLRTGTVSPSAPLAAVSGTMHVPAIMFRFKDSPVPGAGFAATDYNAVLFATSPPAGKPYTYRSYYTQLTNGLIDVQGGAFGFATLDSNEVWYTGGTSSTCASQNPFGNTSNCNGLFSGLAEQRMQSGLREALSKLDASVDFAQFADSTGFVPFVLFLHFAMGGECGPQSAPQNHLWAHRFSLAATSPGVYTTQDNDPFHPGQKVKINDYILQPAVGGASSCDVSQIMPVGTVAHETGHTFGLPDLYGTDGNTEGVGEWSLMGSGNFTTALSPSRMDAWSLSQLGWVTVAPLTTTGTYSFDAAPLSDTVFYVRVQGANPRGEYFLLENRQRQQSDSAMIRIHCARSGNPGGCGGGLLIYHVDSAKIAQGLFSNDVQSGLPHGLAVVQADAFGNLDAQPVSGNFCGVPSFAGCSNRGDAADLYAGPSANTALVFRTTPAALKNADQTFAGFGVDSIRQLVTDRTMSFRLRFGGLSVVRASDPLATIQFDGVTYTAFTDLVDEGSSHTIAFVGPQLSGDGRRRFNFASWSDGGAASHTITGHLAGDTLIATVSHDYKLIATTGGGGTIQADTAINLTTGTFITEGRAVTLTATPDSGLNFGGWSGDTVTLNLSVTLPMGRPYTVTATFGSLTVTSSNARPNGVMGAAYLDTLKSAGGTGTNTWTITGGALPQGLTLNASTGVVSGFLQQAGDFSYTVQLTSGAQSQSRTFTFSVTTPTLVTSDVVTQLLGPGAPLNADQTRYLDFLGNHNGSYDIGDFLAWVKATGAPLSAAVLQAVQRKGGRQ
jgi:M6 family metalloprotease-like protein